MKREDVMALRRAGKHEEHLAAARAFVAEAPGEVGAQIEAAYGHDRNGFERDAIRYYDAAYALGVPADEQRGFLVGYGSTLRNVGRADDAVGVLARAVVDDPHYAPYQAFLSLALMSAGHPRAAIATLLGLALDIAPAAFDGYERALGEYHRELLAQPGDEPGGTVGG